MLDFDGLAEQGHVLVEEAHVRNGGLVLDCLMLAEDEFGTGVKETIRSLRLLLEIPIQTLLNESKRECLWRSAPRSVDQLEERSTSNVRP